MALGSFDFLFDGDFWWALYAASRIVGIVLILALAAFSFYIFLQVWPFLPRLFVREGLRVYRAPQLRATLEDVEQVATRKKWAGIVKRAEREGAAGYTLSIIEADVLLEQTLGRIGIVGRTIADRLKALATDELPNLQDVWEAHALRNRIAHESGFVPSREETARSLAAYKKALEELGAM